jgi:hypothetical protein
MGKTTGLIPRVGRVKRTDESSLVLHAAVTKRQRIRASDLYLPGDLWEHIMHFVDWETLKALSQTNSRLWSYLNVWDMRRFQVYGTHPLQRIVLSQCTLLYQVRAVLDCRCQLCGGAVRETVYVHPMWKLHAHAECIESEVISFKKAMVTYDFTFEQLRHLPHYMGMIWKYHGGRARLPFDVRDTLQGLCLRMHNESLYDRRVRMGQLREEFRRQNRQQRHEHEKFLAVCRQHQRQHRGATDLPVATDRRRRLDQLLSRYALSGEVIRHLRHYVCVDLKDQEVQWDHLQEVVAQHTAHRWTDQSTVRVFRHPEWLMQPALLYRRRRRDHPRQ